MKLWLGDGFVAGMSFDSQDEVHFWAEVVIAQYRYAAEHDGEPGTDVLVCPMPVVVVSSRDELFPSMGTVLFASPDEAAAAQRSRDEAESAGRAEHREWLLKSKKAWEDDPRGVDNPEIVEGVSKFDRELQRLDELDAEYATQRKD